MTGCFHNGLFPIRETTSGEVQETTSGEAGLVGAGGGFAGFYFFEEPDDSDAEETEE